MLDLTNTEIVGFRSKGRPFSKGKKEPGNQPVGPIEFKIRAELNRLNSKYPDTFDWSLYDKLFDRYGDNQPRGGVSFKTTFKLVNHNSTCSKCLYAFELDTYGRGCIHNCTYCYALDRLSQHGYWNRPIPFPVDLLEVRKVLYTVFETDRPSKWRDVLEQRVPLRIGSMSDSFMATDRKYRVTYELLKLLKFYQYPYIVFTRSDLVADDEYMDVLDRELASIQFSICGNNEELTKVLEPGAPSVSRRLRALETLVKNNFWTTVRINPVFPIFPDGYFTNPKEVHERFGNSSNVPQLKFFDWSLVDDIAHTGCKSILAGFVRLSSSSINRMSQTLNMDLRQFFKTEEFDKRGDKKFSDAEIFYYYKKIKEGCDRNGLRFQTCYIGNGIKDFYQYQTLWSNKKDCCDAKGNVNGFAKSSQDIPWDVRLKHATCTTTATKAKEQEFEFESNLKTNTETEEQGRDIDHV